MSEPIWEGTVGGHSAMAEDLGNHAIQLSGGFPTVFAYGGACHVIRAMAEEITEWRMVVNELETEPTPKGLVKLSNKIFERQTLMVEKIKRTTELLKHAHNIVNAALSEGLPEVMFVGDAQNVITLPEDAEALLEAIRKELNQ
jgi:pantoate kinase